MTRAGAASGVTLYARPADLPRHLRGRCMAAGHAGLHVFHHPFCVAAFPLAFVRPIEELLAEREAAAWDALAGGDAAGHVFAHERPYRLDRLIGLAHEGHFDDAPGDYWDLARQVWLDSAIDEQDEAWKELLAMDLPDRDALMRPEDRAALMALPPDVVLHRGVGGEDRGAALRACRGGHSWTVSRDVAERFAARFSGPEGQGWIATARISRSTVFACFEERGEEEVVVRPADLVGLEIALHPL